MEHEGADAGGDQQTVAAEPEETRGLEGSGPEDVIQDDLERPGLGDLGSGDQGREPEHEEEAGAVGLQVAPHPAKHMRRHVGGLEVDPEGVSRP